MNYNASVSDFFKCPSWKMNLLLGAVSILIPIVGPIVLTGWLVTGFWGREFWSDPSAFPPFDFDRFVKYLERGLWPFLVNLVCSLVLVALLMVIAVPLIIVAGVMDSGHGHGQGTIAVVVIMAVFLLQVLLMLFYQVLVTPLVLRATITQDFKSSFDFGFARDFLTRMWKELLASMVFMLGLGLCMMILMVITCYIGGLFALPVLMFSHHHIQKQLYQIYLSRGGAAAPASPKLRDAPPPLTPA